MSRTAFTAAAVLALAGAACGSGGPDLSGASSSSGGGGGGGGGGGTSSSGSPSPPPEGCTAICFTGAVLEVEESNTDGRLEGATVVTCYRETSCARGTLARRDGGDGYTLALEGDTDGASVHANVRAASDPTNLRIEVTWSLGSGTVADVADGDTYTISASVSEEGAELFSQTFTATYADETECSSTCKVYRSAQ